MSKERKDILKGNNDSDFEKFLETTSEPKVPSSNLGKEAAWNNLMQSIEQNDFRETKAISITSNTIWYSAAALILMLFAIASLSYRYSMIEVQSPKGEYANILLPDSSDVMINADSKIEYRRFGWLSNREIKPSGEAYFTVKHGNRFAVLTEHKRNIIVTGTKFNVFARGIQAEVKCFEGSVTVETPTSKPIALAKGNGISINKAIVIPEQFEVDSAATPKWTEGEFYFNNTPFDEVLDELSRQFDITITTIGFTPTTKNYTGFFKRNSLTQALDFICLPMGLTYQISSDSTSVRIKFE